MHYTLKANPHPQLVGADADVCAYAYAYAHVPEFPELGCKMTWCVRGSASDLRKESYNQSIDGVSIPFHSS